MPSFSTGAAGDYRGLGWLLTAAIAAAVCLWMWNRSPSRANKVLPAVVVAWPIAPDMVSTGAQLIQAFDYLALLLLGQQAVCWNHRRIADSLGRSDSPRGQAALRLAGVYELVRYAEDSQLADIELTEPQRQAVRRDLCLLAAPSVG